MRTAILISALLSTAMGARVTQRDVMSNGNSNMMTTTMSADKSMSTSSDSMSSSDGSGSSSDSMTTTTTSSSYMSSATDSSDNSMTMTSTMSDDSSTTTSVDMPESSDTSSTSSSGMTTTSTSSAMSSSTAATCANQLSSGMSLGMGNQLVTIVQVSNLNGSMLRYTPDNIAAPVGSIVQFQFHPKNHTVTESSFGEPCKPLAKNLTSDTRPGQRSGFVPVGPMDTDMKVYNMLINDTKPIWIFCGQVGHCQKGMVMVVNQNPNSTDKTLDKYRAAAAMVPLPGNSTNNSMPNSSSPTPTSSGMSTSTTSTSSASGTNGAPAAAQQASGSAKGTPAAFTGAAVPRYIPSAYTGLTGLMLAGLAALI